MAGGVCIAGGMCGRGHAWQGACMAGGVWQGDMRGGGVRGIQSMSGRYASYWNAFSLRICNWMIV